MFNKIAKLILGQAFLKALVNQLITIVIMWIIRRMQKEPKFRSLEFTRTFSEWLLTLDLDDFYNDEKNTKDISKLL